MRRRDLLAMLGGVVIAVPLAARAQQAALPLVGFLHSGSPEFYADQVAAIRQGLNEAGYFEGQNATIEFRWAEGQYDRLPTLAADLVARKVAVIVAITIQAAVKAKAATAIIPIVFAVGSDPVKLNLVASFNRPGGNITGVSFLSTSIVAKRLELLHEVVPKAGIIAVLVNPNNPNAAIETRELEDAAVALGIKLYVLNASAERDIDSAFASVVQLRVGALLVAADAFLLGRRDQLLALTERHSVPAIYEWREAAAAGGLMSYGASRSEVYRQVGVYTGRILKGEKPADLPVQRSTRVELVINLKTAKALGLTVPQSLLLRADEVIQ